MIHYTVDQKKQNEYLARLEAAKEQLNPESKAFLEEFTHIDEDNRHYGIGYYWREITQDRLDRMEYCELADIFPEAVYPALDVLIGERFRRDLIEICKNLPKWSYTYGYYRRMFRSENYRHHFNRIANAILSRMINLHLFELDVILQLKGEGNSDSAYFEIPEYYALEIDRGNPEVIAVLKEMMLSENNTGLLTRGAIEGIVRAENAELMEILRNLLLAAKLQEGLRQNICEAMDGGLWNNFVYLFDAIAEHDFIRFSSVKRAIATFTAVHEENGDRITKKEVEIIHALNHGKLSADELLKSEDNLKVLLGLWKKGAESVENWQAAIYEILKHGKHHSHLLVSYVLGMVQDSKTQNQIAKDMIRRYAQDDATFEQDGLEILACFLPYLMGGISYYRFDDEIKNKSFAKYFSDVAESAEMFDILERAILAMPTKEKVYSPCIFPWHAVSIKREALASAMGKIAVLSEDMELRERMTDYISDIVSYWQGDFIRILYQNAETPKQRDMLIRLLGNRASATAKIKEIIVKNGFALEYLDTLAGYFRLKTAEIRQALIEIIYAFPEADLEKVLTMLLSQKDVQKRLGGLDLLLKCKQDKKLTKAKIKQFLKLIAKPTDSEKVLIEELLADNLQAEAEQSLYHMEYRPDIRCRLESAVDVKRLFLRSVDELWAIMEKLSALYTQYENQEFRSPYGYEFLLSNSFQSLKTKNYWEEDKLEDYPLPEVWLRFYQDEIGDFQTLRQLYEMLNCGSREDDKEWKELEALLDGQERTAAGAKTEEQKEGEGPDKLEEMLGMDIYALADRQEEEELKYFGGGYRNNQCESVIRVLYHHILKEHKAEVFAEAKAVFRYLMNRYRPEELAKIDEHWDKRKYLELYFERPYLSRAKQYLDYYQTDEDFAEIFSFKYEVDRQMNELAERLGAVYSDSYLYTSEIAYAVSLGLILPDALYQYVLSKNRDKLRNRIQSVSSYLDGSLPDPQKPGYTYSAKPEAIMLIKEHGRKMIDFVIASELKRGDMPLPYSWAIHKIDRVEGIDNLIAVLKALGNLKLDRNSWYWSGGDTKQATLSHLLKVSYPLEQDTAAKLKKALKGTNIDTLRLTEVAMYSPQWIPILEEYLGWKGLAEGCYYFHAHTSDVDRKKEALFAKYTPISIEDLEAGAFDIDWFRSAYRELGEKNFEMLYESAKYISDGAKHGRARKFADAVLGKFKVKDTEKEIESKRNKDLVASYGLIPLAKNKDKDLLGRYRFLQKFAKDSRQFGAQRRASEAKAFQIALENLARNAGYGDVTRLIWKMETNLIDEMKALFLPQTVGEITACLRLSEDGQSELLLEKGGKPLGSLPAKYKKDKVIEELKEANKNLKEQYRRSKKMLEEAMEDATVFYAEEIGNLLSNNPVVAPLLRDLVMKSGEHLGYYRDGMLHSPSTAVSLDADSEVVIAHALDLYQSGQWTEFQKDLFERRVKQPFKQVFRELYVKTEEEIGKDSSLRYAGHQVQPSKTVAVLKTRRWVVDGEEGLQKVYYKQNIIAKIYALADWFSPAEMEAPTLEWVQFYDRKSGKPLKMEEVPDLIFTEVMRDVDLAVSVAHVGGVDPETSHSTVEMRKAIVQFNLPLFRLENVSFAGSHAVIRGTLGEYSVHLGSGLVHQKAGAAIHVLPVHSQHRGRLFLPFVDEDPKTAEIMAKIIFFAEDGKIKDPSILSQIITPKK